jgi:hypothetical protein
MEGNGAVMQMISTFPKLNTKLKVLLRGPVLTQSGYGVHVRQLAKWLMDKENINLHVHALPWGDTTWLIDKNHDNGFIGKIMEKTVDPSEGAYDVTFQLQLPNEWNPKLGKTNIGLTAGVETDACNPEWLKCCDRMSMVVVPSEHAKKSFTNTGKTKTDILVVAESYSASIEKNKKTRIDDLNFSTNFNFL